MYGQYGEPSGGPGPLSLAFNALIALAIIGFLLRALGCG